VKIINGHGYPLSPRIEARSLDASAHSSKGRYQFSKLHLLIEVCGSGMADFTDRNATLQFGELVIAGSNQH
jgi:hypothetical protein